MATTNIFRLETAEVIEEAFELIGLEMRTGYDLVRARRSLNIMLQDWANRGVNLWKVEKVVKCLKSKDDAFLLEEGDLDIIDAVVRYNNQDYPLHRATRADYLTIPNKEQTGRPTEFYVERSIIPKIYYWPIPPADYEYDMIAYIMRNIDTVEGGVESVNVPSRFIKALTDGLAFSLARKVAPERMEDALSNYNNSFSDAMNEDSERGSMMIFPDNSYA